MVRFACATLIAAVLLATAAPLGAAGATVTASALASLLGRIKHIIVLMEENRSFDHFFGTATKKLKVNGLSGGEFNLRNLSDPSQGRVFAAPNARYINPCDPNHGTPATASKMRDAMGGFVDWENSAGHGTAELNFCDVMESFELGKIPVATALAEQFAVMDRMFCSHPGPTWPNRLYALTATSNGMTETGTWHQDQPGALFPQPAFFDQVEASGMTWRNYYNDTPWEMFLEKIAHNPDNVRPLTELFDDAKKGTLPNYAWINPRCGMNVTTGQGSNDQHPDHDVALGEALIKDIYESLRASPQWNETLFIVTYDEHGGFYDHVVPPNAPRPDEAGPSYPDPGFNFSRLGVRIPTLLVSPWIEKGTVLSAPPAAQRPQPDSEYDLTSIMATARKLLGMPPTPLTKRDAWSGTFEHLIAARDAPRTDCPAHLPDAPKPELDPAREAAQPLNGLQRGIAEVHAHVAGDAGGHRDVAGRTQGHLSGWLQERYSKHASATAAWRRSKAAPGPTVVCTAPSWKGWAATFKLNFASAVPWKTVSATLHNQTICLEHRSSTKGDAAAAAGATAVPVATSLCYPSAAPATNRDRDQQWMVHPDATVRPAADASMCLTIDRLSADAVSIFSNVSVALCDGRVEQHFATSTGVGPSAPRDGIGSLSYATEASIGVAAE